MTENTAKEAKADPTVVAAAAEEAPAIEKKPRRKTAKAAKPEQAEAVVTAEEAPKPRRRKTVKKKTEPISPEDNVTEQVTTTEPADAPKSAAEPAETAKEEIKDEPKTEEKEERKAAPAETNIFKAIAGADVAAVKFLLPAQMNKRDSCGRTPLMIVCKILGSAGIKRDSQKRQAYKEIEQALIAAGCNRNAMDDAGNTARDYRSGGLLDQMIVD